MGNRRRERPPEAVLYGGMQTGGFVNGAVKCKVSLKTEYWYVYPSCALFIIISNLHIASADIRCFGFLVDGSAE